MWRLLRKPDFALLWTGGLLSLAGDWVLFVGLPLYVYDQTGSTLATGTMFLARLVPQVLLGSFAGVFTDQWDRKRSLVVTNVLLAFALLPMFLGAWSETLWLIYLAAFLTSALQQFVAPAEDALLPRLVDGPDDLVPANALNALNNNLARLAGPPLGALLYAVWGLGGVVVVDIMSFVFAAALIAAIKADARPIRASEPGAAVSAGVARWREWLAGLRLVRTERTVAVLILFAVLAGLGEGVMGALFVPFVRDVLRADDFAYGALLAAQAVGALAGGLVIGRFARATAPVLLWGSGALGLAAVDAAIFLYPLRIEHVAPAVVLFLVVGVPVSAMLIGVATARQLSVPDVFRGRLIGSYRSVQALAMAGGTLVAGALGEFVGIVSLLMTQVVVYGVGGALVLVLLRGLWSGSPGASPSVSRADP